MLYLRMINISTSKHLDIVTPSTNRALAKVLSNASPKELEIINNSKDLKSIMGSILKGSADTSSDKELLQLVKNNPTLKNLGDTSTTIKDLLHTIKSDKNPLPLEIKLKNFLIDIKDVKQGELKVKLENSGVFLESKLKATQNPQVELKNTLLSLVKELQTSKEPVSKTLIAQIKELLNVASLKSASNEDIVKNIKSSPAQLEKLSTDVSAIVSKLKGSISKSDSIHSPLLQKAMQRVDTLLQSNNLSNTKILSLEESLKSISTEVSKSFTLESKTLLNSLDKILTSLKSLENVDILSSKKVPQEISKLTTDIKVLIQKADPLFQKTTTLLLNKLDSLNSPTQLNPQNQVKDIISNDLKAILLQAGDEIVKSNNPNQSELLKHIDKLSLQIDYHQLLSHLSNSSSLYLPFSWDMMKEGNIEIKHDDKNRFYCDIDLNLEEYGEVNLKLTIFDGKQLNLHIYSQNSEFKELVKEALPSLRSALIEVDINPREIRVYEPTKKISSPYDTQEENLYMGFEVKA